MLRNLILAAGVAFALLTPAYAADPQTFKTEDSATAFCKTGNVAHPGLCRRPSDIQDGGQRNGILQDRERGLVQPGIEDLFPAWLAVLRQDQGRRLHLPSGG